MGYFSYKPWAENLDIDCSGCPYLYLVEEREYYWGEPCYRYECGYDDECPQEKEARLAWEEEQEEEEENELEESKSTKSSITESFEIHETLNEKLWDINTNKLKPEIRQRLIEIVKYFEGYIEVPISICDVQLVGSNASYNYTPHSDLDVHLIANFNVPGRNKELLQALYDTKKAEFNARYDIKVKGIEVELYVQDVRSNILSNGIYSLCDDEWIKEPKPIKSITKHNVEKELERWDNIIKQVLASNNSEEIEQIINTLYLIRHNSIAVEGENGKGNQLFKEIRGKGWLQRLKDARDLAISHDLSLESLSEGAFINRYNK